MKLSLISVALLAPQVIAAEQIKQRDEIHIEHVQVTASPLSRSVMESAQPISILSGEALDKSQAATLGETLKNLPGVHSTYYGPVSSSPIIRGLDGPRVKIVQNGMDSSDASRVGPDHVVTTEASNASQIEVLRGPATLLYGSGAIGGVVNVVDNRLPRERQEKISGEAAYQHDTVSSENLFNLNLNGGSGNLAWHIDGFDRDSDDYEIPVAAQIDAAASDEENGVLENSAVNANGFNIGLGWVGEDINIALAYGYLDNQYGIPGHGHHEDEHGEEHDGEHEGEHAEEEVVFAKLKQDRLQGMVDWLNLDGLVSEVHWHSAYTDYSHSEIENGAIGTTFNNESTESRLWIKHQPMNGWQGVLGLHYSDNDFVAVGEEAFTPPSDSRTLALFVLEEKQTGDLLWQLGGRIEDVKITPDNRFFEHADEHEGEDEHEHEEEHAEIAFNSLSYTPWSLSAGVVWSLNDHHSLAFNYAYSERAPSAAELFSNGAHIGTNTYEVGAGFMLEQHDDEFEIVQSNAKVVEEVSKNLDLTWRYQSEHLHASVSLFYNDIDDYLFQQDSGLFIEGGHVHGHDDLEHEEQVLEQHAEEEHHHGGDLPLFLFQQQDAKLYGFEAELDWHFTHNWRLATYADYTRAKLDNNGNVPRIPPLRIGAELHWEHAQWHAELGTTWYQEQDNIAAFETETDGYSLISAAVNYYANLGDNELVIFVKGNNLGDKEARVHSSFLKDEAPLPGRSFVLGAKVNF